MTDDKREALLRRVRGLIAKAQATDFPEEKLAFESKAHELMEQYAIETWMLETGDEEKAKLITKREFDMSWWQQTRGMDIDVRSPIWWMFDRCVDHARCYTSRSAYTITGTQYTQTVYGLAADLDYLDMLFTDLFVQLFGRLKPVYDPTKSLGENCYIAKEAGMSWEQIARWCGEADKVRTTESYNHRTGRYTTKTNVDGKFVKAYKKWCDEHGLERRTVHPTAWAVSYVEAFYYSISERFRAMNPDDRDTGSGHDLVLRDIRKAAEEALYDDHPELRPHEADCLCDACKAAANRKPVKYRKGHQTIYAAYDKGRSAGREARIADRSAKLSGNRKRLGQ
jgi:hypothetical protein